MKKVVFALAIMFAVTALLPGYVLAQGQDGADSSETNPSDVAPNAQSVEKRTERVQAYKDRLEASLSAVEERRITAACRAAQAITMRLVVNIDSVAQKRKAAYDNISDKLTTVIEKVQLAGVDTTELEAKVTELNSMVADLLTKVADYKTTVNDLSELDCQANPDEFKAALEYAKTQRVEIVSSSKAIRNFVQESLKPVLSDIRIQLTNTTEGDQ